MAAPAKRVPSTPRRRRPRRHEDPVLLLRGWRPRRVLRPDEERELARLVAAGDERARRVLIEANLRLVVAMARR